MNEFIIVKLKDIGRIVTGKTPSSKEPESYGESYLFITPSDNFENKYIDKTLRSLSEYGKNALNGKLLKENSVLVTCIGSAMGKVALNKFPAATNQQINSIEVKEAFSSDYIYYCLKNNYKLFRNAASGSTALPILNKTDFEELPIKIHKNLKTQQSIAAVLSALDKKIALNKQINARLEEMAKTLYDYWFVQFDFPDTNGKPYKSSGGEMVFDETLKREIPKGWEVKKLKDAMQIVRGASPRPIDDFLSDDGIPWIKISDATATSTPFIFKTKEFIKSNGKQYSRYLYPNTLILSNSATPGIPRIVELECCVHDGWLIIENLKNGLFNEFMYFYFLNFKEKIINLGSGSIFKNLKTEYIKELDLIIPNEEILENAKIIFSDVFKKIKNTQKQNHQLTQLRDFLLPMLMNGQVSVAE